MVCLGNSGLRISKIILRCLSYGSSEWQPWVLNKEESINARAEKDQYMQVLHDVIMAGYARCIGVSLCYVWQCEQFKELSKKKGVSMVQVALAQVLQRDSVNVAIVGTTLLANLHELFGK
ncbi:Versiconal hemiacetal acetate reductase [Leucoagaricus sp. SymC.cos]|nr:Versiconal hemiacetal acetate reductase [Leucoagaricus sp. SymC.cos]